MNFVDFQLRAWVASDEQVQVLVHSSPVGGMRHPVKVPFKGDEFKSICDWIRKVWLSEPGIIPRMVEAGKHLSKILLPLEVNNYLVRSLARVGDDGLRVRLCLDEALIDGPWEFMYRPDALEDEILDGFLVLNPRLSLVREAPVESSTLEPSEEEQRMVIVGAFRNDGKDQWQVREEREKLTEAIEPVKEFLKIDERFTSAAGNQIQEALRTPLSVFHYCGHVQIENDRGFLVREITSSDYDDAVCESAHFSPLYSDRELNLLLSGAKARIAVFSACNSGRWPFVEPILKSGIKALVGVQGSTTCDAAIDFCQKLYSSLAIGLSLDEAVIYARQHLKEARFATRTESCEWGSYMVYMPTSEAVLLPKPEQRPNLQAQQAEVHERVIQFQNKRSLRLALMKDFTEGELSLLCADIEEEIKTNGRSDFELDLEVAGGTAKEAKILNLIEYLERRQCLPYLVNAVRRERPGISI